MTADEARNVACELLEQVLDDLAQQSEFDDYKTIRCDQCAASVIQGVPCHETGCPSAHIDLATDKPYQVECSWCGSLCDQSPRGAKSFCDDSCAESYSS